MFELTGIAIAEGVAEGTAYLGVVDDLADLPHYYIDIRRVDEELGRFRRAVEKAACDLERVRKRALAELGQAPSGIFAAHLTIVRDSSLIDSVSTRIQEDLVNAEQAVATEISILAVRLNAVQHGYLRQRAQDVRDVGRRIVRHLSSRGRGEFAGLPASSIVVATQLLPSDTLDLDRHNLAGIVTEQGGATSHFAILARSLGVPAVTGVFGASSRIEHGQSLLVDGNSGRVIISPRGFRRGRSVSFAPRGGRENHSAEEAPVADCRTRDGQQISLLANINRGFEASMAAEHRLDGVGLLRTEFLFLGSTNPPTRESQEREYRLAAAELQGKPIVIRTLDPGGDKIPAFLSQSMQARLQFGLRGLRFSLVERELFDTQVQAIASLVDDHDVRILLPMVLGRDDFHEAVVAIEAAARAMGSRRPPVGAMIETPAALMCLEDILEVAEFVSVGTNDLTQFMLAADRTAAERGQASSVLHPSVLRAIKRVVEVSRSAGREVAVCGEAAGDPLTVELLVGLGIRQLSMSPLRTNAVRGRIRSLDSTSCRALADEAMLRGSARAVEQLIQEAAHGKTDVLA